MNMQCWAATQARVCLLHLQRGDLAQQRARGLRQGARQVLMPRLSGLPAADQVRHLALQQVLPARI